MNKKQLISLWSGVMIACAVLVYPPWRFETRLPNMSLPIYKNAGKSFFFNPPEPEESTYSILCRAEIDFGKLILPILLTTIITAASIFSFRDFSERKSTIDHDSHDQIAPEEQSIKSKPVSEKLKQAITYFEKLRWKMVMLFLASAILGIANSQAGLRLGALPAILVLFIFGALGNEIDKAVAAARRRKKRRVLNNRD